MSHASGEPPVEPPKDSTNRWNPDEISVAVQQVRSDRPVGDSEGGCLAIFGKAVLIFIIGVFVLAGLVFASCFLSFRR